LLPVGQWHQSSQNHHQIFPRIFPSPSPSSNKHKYAFNYIEINFIFKKENKIQTPSHFQQTNTRPI
jgi:hypothetical protein